MFKSKGIRDWISISSILILFLSNSGIVFSTNFRVEPYDTTVISVPGLIISIFPKGTVNSPKFNGSFSFNLYAFKGSIMRAGSVQDIRVLYIPEA